MVVLGTAGSQAYQFDLYKMICVAPVISQKMHAAIQPGDNRIDIAVVIIIKYCNLTT
jgi:hypothetical protein